MSDIEWNEPFTDAGRSQIMKSIKAEVSPKPNNDKHINSGDEFKTKNTTHSKIDFIQDLLGSSLLEANHKEKLLQLVANELRSLESNSQTTKKEVEIIKKKIQEISDAIGDNEGGKKPTSSKNEENSGNQTGISKSIHNPQKLVNLLSKFRKEGSALKYAVHKWDLGTEFEDYKSFIEQLRADYNEISWDLKELREGLNAKCYGFLLNQKVGNNGWGYDRIPAGWSSPELASWCRENPEKSPFNRPIKSSYPKKGINFSVFEDVVNHFKMEIEVRNEGDQLKKIIIKELNRAHLLDPFGEFNRPELINLESKTFYTDVQWMRAAIAIIFKEIKKRGEGLEECKDVTIEAIEDNESVMLKIVHKNSFTAGDSIKINNKLTSIGGDFLTIKNKLMNLCDWSIENKFKEGFFRLNYLCSNNSTPFIEEIDSCEGFSHFLKFYKSNL